MNFLIKALAWTIVITGWTVYGLVTLVSIFHPGPQTNPVEDIQGFWRESFSREHWKFHLNALLFVILFIVAWSYIRKDKEEQQKGKQQ